MTERTLRTQAIKQGSRILGDAMKSKGMHMMTYTTSDRWVVRQAKYQTRARPLSANERFLSEEHYRRFKEQPRDPKYKNEGYTHKPKANERLTTIHRDVMTRDGKGFQRTQYDMETSRKRRATRRVKGAALYRAGQGVPVLGTGLALYFTYQDYVNDNSTDYPIQNPRDMLSRTPQGSVMLGAEQAANIGFSGSVTNFLTGGNFSLW